MMCLLHIIICAILIYGETQTGKSTMVNALIGKEVSKSGDGKGHSITTHPSVHSKSYTKTASQGILEDINLYIMDTPGNLDTELRWSDKDILNNILFAIQTSGTDKIDVLFVSESLSGDAIQLTRNIGKIKELFGERVMKGIVVLGLKPDLSVKIHGNDKRSKEVDSLCKQIGIKYLSYESFKSYEYNDQFKSFMDIIFDNDIKSYKMEEIDRIKTEIEKIAKELMNEAPIQYDVVDVETEVVKYKDVKRQETYWHRKWGEIGRGSRRWGIAGPRKRIDGWIPVQKTRTVIDKKPYTVKEIRQKKVEIPKDIKTFRTMAQNEWEKKMKDSLKIKIDFKTEL